MNKGWIFGTLVVGIVGFIAGTFYGKKEAKKELAAETNANYAQLRKECEEHYKKQYEARVEEYHHTIEESLEKARQTNQFVKKVTKEGYDMDILPGGAPRLISDLDAGEDGYSMLYYSLYTDGVLSDENDERLTDAEIERIIGRDIFKKALETNTDLYVRNEKLKCDIEIEHVDQDYTEEASIDAEYDGD